jgi:NCS1 family nucleobase:cation symporter-1
LGIVSIAGTILGYDLIHTSARLIAYASGAAFALTLIYMAVHHSLALDLHSQNKATIQGVLGAISIAALWQIAYAPYVSDYSRYLPPDTGVRPAFWASYWGSVLGSTLPMIVGTVIGLIDSGKGVIATLGAMTSGIAPVTFVIFSIAMVINNAMNVYCGALSTLTAVQTWRPNWNPGWQARSTVALMLLAVALALAVLGHDSFLESYTSFILLLFYVLIPWTAINLVDYYLLRHGKYDVDSFFRGDGGVYGRYNVTALSCYFLGTFVQLPFVSTPLFRGPVARALNDADLSWIVGLVVTSAAYYALARRALPSRVSRTLW